jgi:hypothetical protein
MVMTVKFVSALDVVALKMGCRSSDVLEFWERNDFSQERLYRGLAVMSYQWNGEIWVHVHKLPFWWGQLRGRVGVR